MIRNMTPIPVSYTHLDDEIRCSNRSGYGMIRLSKAKERDFVKEQECTLDLHTIEAAVAGEKWALEKVLAYYADYIVAVSYTHLDVYKRQAGDRGKGIYYRFFIGLSGCP